MLKAIKAVPNRKITDIEKLQQTNLPIVMYGAGSYAMDVTKFLSRQGVHIAEYCVDAGYLQANPLFMGEFPVMAIEDTFAKYPEFDVVIGLADYRRAKESIAKHSKGARVYFFDAPNHMEFFDYEYIKQHKDKFEATYNMLEDQTSKDIFIAFINAKISGDPSDLYKFADINQYFCEQVTLIDDEVLVDCGAFDGDTISNFIRKVNGKYRKIFAFEPDGDNYKQLLQNLNSLDIKHVETYNRGCWSEKTVLNFSSGGSRTSIVTEGGDFSVEVDSIDNIVKGDKVTYIKMDIEGAELEALRGAQKTIRACKPKIAVCAYHKPEDLITLPQYIQSIINEYKFYLRHHQFISWDMVLYAIPK